MLVLADELARLSDLKAVAAASGTDHGERKAEFKTHEAKCVELMQAQKTKSHRGEDGTLYTRMEDRVKGQVEDRRKYVRWCLEQDEAIQEFLAHMRACFEMSDPGERELSDGLIVEFYDAITNTELVSYQAKQDKANALARAHIDDNAALPPGLTFRPDPYIQQRRS